VPKTKDDILIETNFFDKIILSEEINNEDEIIFRTNSFDKNIPINIGETFIIIPDDYHIGYFNGDKYEYTLINDNNLGKYFHIMVFNKNKDFDGADSSYTSENIPFLDNYINGISDDMSRFFGKYRRNIYNNVKVAERLVLCQHEIINIMFERQISFIYNDFVYIFTIYIDNVDKLFLREMENYFEIKEGYFSNEDPYGWISEGLTEIYQHYIDYNKLPFPIEKLFTETDIMFNSVRIIN
jgi:hypothetical protein